MNIIILILKGFIVGIGKIIPGVSGSLLAFSLGIYEESINRISNIFKNFKNNIIYLGSISIGVVLAIVFFSKVVLYLLSNYYLYTISLFIGLIIGTIPYILKDLNITKKRNIIYSLLSIVLVVSIYIFKSNKVYNITNYFYILLLGFIDALTMIIPGISGTATFMMLGCYNYVLKLFSNPFSNLVNTFIFGIGLLLGILIISKIVNYLLRTRKEELYLSVLGFTISSIVYLFVNIVSLINIYNIIIVIVLLIIGYAISYRFA